MRQVQEKYLQINGIRLCYMEWGTASPGAETYLLIHATGFHSRCWDQTIASMGEAHVIAVDMRGHGRSDNDEPLTWRQFGDDVIALVQELDLDTIVGAGHSMGGHSITPGRGGTP